MHEVDSSNEGRRVTRRLLLKSGSLAAMAAPVGAISFRKSSAFQACAASAAQPVAPSYSPELVQHASDQVSTMVKHLRAGTATKNTFAAASSTMHMVGLHLDELNLDAAYAKQVSAMTYADYVSRRSQALGDAQVSPLIPEDQFEQLRETASKLGISGIMHSHADVFKIAGSAILQSPYHAAVWNPLSQKRRGGRNLNRAQFQEVTAFTCTPYQKMLLCNTLWTVGFLGTINAAELAIFCWVASLATMQVELGVLCSLGAGAIIASAAAAILLLQTMLGC